MKSSSLRVPKRRRTFSRLLGQIQHELNQALDEEHAKRGLTRAEMARVIGRDKAFITKRLTGTANMTLETLSDLAFSLDRDIRISLPVRTGAAGSNHVEMPSSQASTNPSISIRRAEQQIIVSAA